MTLKADLDRILGSAWHVAGKDFHTRIAHVENAGAPTTVTPDFIGQMLRDTTNDDWYISYGTASGNWVLVGIDTLTAAELGVLDGATDITALKITALGKSMGVEAVTSTTSTLAATGLTRLTSTASLTYGMAAPVLDVIKRVAYSVASTLTASTAVALAQSSGVTVGNGYTTVTFQGNGAVELYGRSATNWDIVGSNGTVVIA